MSVTRITALVVGLSLSLSGCLATTGTAPGTVGLAVTAGTKSAALRQVSLQGGQVVVAGPRGYCVDAQNVRRKRNGHFALIASCASLSGAAVGAVEPAVMTVLALPRDAGAEQPSATDLARSVAPARVLEKIDGDGVSIVHLAGGGSRGKPGGIPGGDARHWRAVMLINGHVTGLALYAPKGSAIAGKAGRSVIIDFAEALREASPVRRAN